MDQVQERSGTGMGLQVLVTALKLPSTLPTMALERASAINMKNGEKTILNILNHIHFIKKKNHHLLNYQK